MVMKSGLSEVTERIGIRLGMIFAHVPLTPNQWTMLSVVPAVLGFFALAAYKDVALALALFAVSAVIDAIDGGVARVTGRVSNFGAYLDGMVDRLVEGFLLFGLMFLGLPNTSIAGYVVPMWAWLALLLFVGSALVSYARAYADHRKVVTDPKKLARMGGILERAERLLLIFLGMLLYFIDPAYLNAAIIIAAILSCITLLQRISFVVANAE